MFYGLFSYNMVLILTSIFFAGTPLLWLSAKAVELSVMKTTVKVKDITEGEWLAEPVKKGNKIILKPPKLGLEEKDLRFLKKQGIKDIVIKKGIPFVPSFFLATVTTYLFHSVVFALLPF